MKRLTARNDRRLIALFAILGGIRVALLSAGLPFWNNVDEKAHADMVMRYAQFRIPDRMERYSPESASLIVACDCNEYILPREMALKYHPPASAYKEIYNLNSLQPPAYYALAGAWYRASRAFGLSGCPAMASVRALNGLLFAILIGVCGALARRFYPGERVIGLGTPILLMALPQDLFYSINADVPSALLCASALLFLPTGRAASNRWAFAGLLASLALLTKYSNLGILASGLAVGWWAWRDGRNRKMLSRGFIFAGIAVALPVLAWLAHNAFILGDPLGMRGKIAWLGWTPRPWSTLLDHPLFTMQGAAYFFGELARRGWRGELVWHGMPMANGLSDGWYTWSTAVFLVVAFIGVIRSAADKRMADSINFAFLLASIAFLVWTSLSWDFGNCPYPSRNLPYLVSARLISGGLTPFVMLYLRGFDRLCPPRWGFGVRISLVGILAFAMFVSDLIIRWPALFLK